MLELPCSSVTQRSESPQSGRVNFPLQSKDKENEQIEMIRTKLYNVFSKLILACYVLNVSYCKWKLSGLKQIKQWPWELRDVAVRIHLWGNTNTSLFPTWRWLREQVYGLYLRPVALRLQAGAHERVQVRDLYTGDNWISPEIVLPYSLCSPLS